MITKLISGGQTGADISALDVALKHDFPHGGWCPKGRKAEDGPIPCRYNVFETPPTSYLQRTEWNVRDSDGTVVFTLAAKITGGSLRTVEFARKHRKPCLHIAFQEPGIHRWAMGVLEDAFFWSENHPGMLGGPGEG